MEVTISNRIYVKEPDETLLRYCRDNLRLRNPEFIKKRRMGFYTGNTPEFLYLYEQDGDTLILPYGCLKVMAERFADPTYDAIRSDFQAPRMVNFHCEVPLYDYQAEAVKAMSHVYCGILQSPAGSGKTQMGIALASKIGRKTLWVTHTKDLLTQSKKRAELYMSPALIGTITEGQIKVGKGITFATVQTLAAIDLPVFKNEWDVIIVDECHHVAGTPTSVTQFSRVLNNLAARCKYGLSATVHRSDGLIRATNALLGEIVYSVPDTAVADKIITPTIQAVPTGVEASTCYTDTDGTIIYASLISYLVEHPRRNKLILDTILRESQQPHSHLILSDRLEHLEFLMGSLPPELRIQAVMVSGSMNTKKGKLAREQAMEDMRSGRKRYLFATYSLAKEGLDIPRLDRLYLATPQKDYAVIVQSVGRISRTAEGKSEAMCFDFVDNIVKMMRFYRQRCRSYKKLGCQIKESPV